MFFNKIRLLKPIAYFLFFLWQFSDLNRLMEYGIGLLKIEIGAHHKKRKTRYNGGLWAYFRVLLENLKPYTKQSFCFKREF